MKKRSHGRSTGLTGGLVRLGAARHTSPSSLPTRGCWDVAKRVASTANNTERRCRANKKEEKQEREIQDLRRIYRRLTRMRSRLETALQKHRRQTTSQMVSRHVFGPPLHYSVASPSTSVPTAHVEIAHEMKNTGRAALLAIFQTTPTRAGSLIILTRLGIQQNMSNVQNRWNKQFRLNRGLVKTTVATHKIQAPPQGARARGG